MNVMDTIADVSGGEVIYCTTLVYFGNFLCLPKALLCLTVIHHNFFTQHVFKYGSRLDVTVAFFSDC